MDNGIPPFIRKGEEENKKFVKFIKKSIINLQTSLKEVEDLEINKVLRVRIIKIIGDLANIVDNLDKTIFIFKTNEIYNEYLDNLNKIEEEFHQYERKIRDNVYSSLGKQFNDESLDYVLKMNELFQKARKSLCEHVALEQSQESIAKIVEADQCIGIKKINENFSYCTTNSIILKEGDTIRIAPGNFNVGDKVYSTYQHMNLILGAINKNGQAIGINPKMETQSGFHIVIVEICDLVHGWVEESNK